MSDNRRRWARGGWEWPSNRRRRRPDLRPCGRSSCCGPAWTPDAVARARLLAALDAGRDRPLVLLSGPAGYGKTTLLGQWLAARGRPAAWVSLDDRDDAPGVLVHLVAALQPRFPGFGRTTLGLLRLPGDVRPADLGAALADELAALHGEAVVSRAEELGLLPQAPPPRPDRVPRTPPAAPLALASPGRPAQPAPRRAFPSVASVCATRSAGFASSSRAWATRPSLISATLSPSPRRGIVRRRGPSSLST